MRPGEDGPLLLQLLPPLPSSPPPPPHYSSHSGWGRARPVCRNLSEMATCAVEVFGLPEDEVRGTRDSERASHRAAHQRDWRRGRRPEGRLSAPSSLCARPGSAPGALGTPETARLAQACGRGRCFRKRHFLRELVDSAPLFSLEPPPSLSVSFRK